jgi:hypothetical protein
MVTTDSVPKIEAELDPMANRQLESPEFRVLPESPLTMARALNSGLTSAPRRALEPGGRE